MNKLAETLLVIEVEHALLNGGIQAMKVCADIIDNRKDISFKTLREIRSRIVGALLNGDIKDIDKSTWDRVYDYIREILEVVSYEV